MRTPYTYRIFHRPTEMYYYGAKYALGCDPSTFWIDYFTSSDAVKKLINEYGVDSFDVEIRKIFKTPEECLKWEARVNRHTMKWPNYLNMSCGNYFVTSDNAKLADNGRKGGLYSKLHKLGWCSPEDASARMKKRIADGYNPHDNLAAWRLENPEMVYDVAKISEKTRRARGKSLGDMAAIGGSKMAGKKWWNNGISHKRAFESPGVGWVSGRIKRLK